MMYLLTTPTDLVVVVDGKSFETHKEILRQSSKVFEKMLNGEFKAATENKIILNHINPKVFAEFMHYLNLGRDYSAPFEIIFALHAFGEQYMITALCANIVNKLLQYNHQLCPVLTFEVAFRAKHLQLMQRASKVGKNSLVMTILIQDNNSVYF